jgi:hypothetical protein
MLPFSLCNKKNTWNLHMNPLSNDTIDSVLRHREVFRAKELPAPLRSNVSERSSSQLHHVESMHPLGFHTINLKCWPPVTKKEYHISKVVLNTWPSSVINNTFNTLSRTNLEKIILCAFSLFYKK